MEKFIPIVIFLVIIIAKVVRSVQDQRQTGGKDSGDGWWEEETPSSPSPAQNQPAPRPPTLAREAPKPKAEPSKHVQDILRQLQQQAQPVPKPRPKPQPEPEPDSARRYLDETRVESELAQAAKAVTEQAVSDVYKQSFAMAFPAAKGEGARLGANQRAPIRVRARGKENLRRAILISEILGAPRAFDV